MSVLYLTYFSVNTGQPAFEAMAQIVQKVQDMLEDKNDCNGRNQVLSAYIQYCCTLPHPGPMHGRLSSQQFVYFYLYLFGWS